MAGLVPAIHVLLRSGCHKDVDGRHKAGHDDLVGWSLADRRILYPTTFKSSGTAASYFELCSTSEVRTLRTCGAAVRWVTKSWNVAMSGATHFKMKSTSPDSI